MTNSAFIGLKNMVYAKLLDETINSYDTVSEIAPAISAKIKPKVNSAILYADNRAVETVSALGEIEVELEVSDIPLEILADLLGHTIDTNTGVITYSSADSAPYVAIGYERNKANGKKRQTWLLKGKFEEVEEEGATGEDKIKFSTGKIKAIFVAREDGNWNYTMDEDSAVAAPSTFLDAVFSPTIDLVAPTVSSSPTDAATGVAVDANVVFTFNKAVNANTITADNVFLMKADGTAVACALTLGTNNTVVTLNPGTNLSGSTAYIAVATTGCKSVANVALAANCVVNFTTA